MTLSSNMKVKAIRGKQGLSVRAVAAKAKMSFTYLSTWRMGKSIPRSAHSNALHRCSK